ncbi:phenylalanine--tRNA ligase subunit beta [Sphingosinicella sp. YJ22]|uniref:phenylalanine--tRNA ligase subunit beta n=1 Tax=Sphingosinicella sp. YJ22 TaxID=1104780 RepID=UPI00140BC800|nr:phenylalanine--tRNA ligase subunit beta [Sphingosinicella sp. YJ22]
MKFTLSWLKEHLDTDASLEEVVERLNSLGLEVEGVDNPGEKLAAFKVAEILTAERHPQADKLQVLTVDAGEGPMQVVCGAPNARAGMKGVFGAPGAYVPGSGITLKIAAIRGVESRGMMCSVRELELGEGHDGIIELPDDAPVGAAFPDYAGLNDAVIDVSVNPNRPEAMGVYGIARDLAASGLGTLKPIDIPDITGTFPSPVEIRIEDKEGCKAFYGRVIRGVRNGPSPDWLARRLQAVGQRSISALVDMTNYITLTYGRPLHVYDLAKLSGAVVARKAKPGEQVEALNGKTYTLDETMTVIADDVAVHDIGGIMGGEHSGVTEATTDILIECAWFDPHAITRTGQKLALASDARSRFERGADPAFVEPGIQLATKWALDLAGGEPSEVVRAGEPPIERQTFAYRPQRCAALAGIDIPEDRQEEILRSLGFDVARGNPWQVTAPTFRPDIHGEADIVEEVARVHGFDKIPSTPLPRADGVARPTATPEQLIERRARRSAAARGLNEAITWSFISEAEAAHFGGAAWTIANPISDDLKVMRPSLLPGLIAAARRNRARGADSVRLFEVGRRYFKESEPLTVGVILAGEASHRHWRSGRATPFDAFDAKDEALALLAAVGAPVDNLQVSAGAGETYHPGRSGKLTLGKAVLAEFGELHPRILKAFDLDGPATAAQIFLDALPPRRGGNGRMRPAYTPPALQAVKRDFAFLVPETLEADRLLRAVRGADKAAIASVSLFDVFTGQGVAQGEKSLALEVVLQPTDKSFTDDELKAVGDRIVAAAGKLGARLRD